MLRAIKILHTLGAIGLMGGAAAVVVLLVTGPSTPAGGSPGLRPAIDALFRWLLVPSMLLCVFSGFLSMFVHKPFWNALWAWLKGVSGMLVLELTFRLQGLASSVSRPEVVGDAQEVADTLYAEWSSLWVLLVVSALNVVVGVWRPKFKGLAGMPQ